MSFTLTQRSSFNLLLGNFRIKELPIPTYYGDEICHVDGLMYAKDVFKATAVVPFHKIGLFYQKKYDLSLTIGAYEPKTEFDSTHSRAIARFRLAAKFSISAAAPALWRRPYAHKDCVVTGLDGLPADEVDGPDNYYRIQLGTGSLPVDPSTYDVVLLLDVIEHLKNPEDFINMLHDHLATSPETEIIATTGNVAFGPVRIMLLLGMFNYGKQGNFRPGSCRLFTFSSFRNIFTQRGFPGE